MKDLYQDVKRNKYGYYELSGIIGEDKLSEFYTNSYYQSDRAVYQHEYTDKDLKEKYNRLEEKKYVIENYLSTINREKKFLDIGCGEGFALEYFLRYGYEVTGIDFSTEGCKYHNPEVLEKIVVGDALYVLDKLYQDKYLGTVLLDHVLEHVVKPEKLIQKITMISRPGTCLIISVPNDFSETQIKLWEEGYIDTPFWVTTSYPPEHLSYFRKESLEKLLAENGWKMEFIMNSFPIDFNLFNENTNYVRNKEVGKSCYRASIEIEELMYKMVGVHGLVDIYRKLGEYGIGRDITAFFIRQ
jgi:2-polyprenyl-3-methyl-5-hydroxy-6-metoxy-1,4-benzoquinol methylase